MIRKYYNDNGEIFIKKPNNNGQGYGKLTYGKEMKLGCYRRYRTTQVLNSNNQIIQSNTSYTTQEMEINENDIIDGRKVVAVDRASADGVKFWRGYV